MPSDMSLSDKPINTPPKRRYATRSATKSENSISNKRGDHHSSSPSELNQLSKHLKRQSRCLKSKNITTPTSSPCELCQASDCQCAGTSRNLTTKSSVQASLPGLMGRVSEDQRNSKDATPKKIVAPKKRIVSALSQKSSQLSLLPHSKKTKDLKAENQPSTIPCSSSQEATQFLKDQHTTKNSKLGNKTESPQQQSQPSKVHRPKKTENSKLKSEILTPSSEPSEVQHGLGSNHSESRKIVIDTRSLSKSMQPQKQQSAMRISKHTTPKNIENVAISLRNSNLVSERALADQKGKAKLPEEPPQHTQYLITWDGYEEPESEPCGLHCYICAEDLAYSLDEEENETELLPEVAVLPCGHAFHCICLSLHTSEKQYSREPKCLACLGFS